MRTSNAPFVINSLVFGVVSHAFTINCIYTHTLSHSSDSHISMCVTYIGMMYVIAYRRKRDIVNKYDDDINRNKENGSNPLKHFPYYIYIHIITTYDYLLFGV